MKSILMAAVAAVTLGMTGAALASQTAAPQTANPNSQLVMPGHHLRHLAGNNTVLPSQRPTYLAGNNTVLPSQRPIYLARGGYDVSPQQRPSYLA